MVNIEELVQQAKELSKDTRKDILMSFKERELHSLLKELFKAMEPNYTVEITHGVNELGKDLVIVKQDNMTIDVIGVVVKCGDIKSKTLGDVDDVISSITETISIKSDKRTKEIESQIRQAYSHPAEIRTFFRTLPVSKVFVVLAGTISIQARTRLEKEVKDALEIFDINWLIEKFTSYYPQIFFEGKVIDFLQNKIQELEKKNWLIKNDKSLSEYYIEPLVSIVELPVSLDNIDLTLNIKQRKMSLSKLTSFTGSNKQILLVGDPGTGKSAALSKLVIDMLRKAHSVATSLKEHKTYINIPILISAKDFLQIDNANTLLKKYFEQDEIIKRFNISTLMIDGLDEVVSSKREEVINKAKDLSKILKCSLILTSRKVDITNNTPSGFEKVELLPFEVSQALKLFEKVLTDNKLLDTLKEGLERIRFQIPIVPLSLMLLIELVEESKEIPSSVTELYDRFVDTVLGREDKKKGIEVLFEYLMKKRFLATLAFSEFYQKNKLEVSRSDFDRFLTAYVSEYGLEKEDFSVFIKEVERGGVIDINEQITFKHRSFLDYFAAFYIYEKREEIQDINQLIINIYFNDVWGDVAFFYIGLKREISEKMLDSILNYDKSDLHINIDKFMVGRLLQAGWHSPTKTKYNGIKKAFGLVGSIRNGFINLTEKHRTTIPKIFADFMLLTFSDISFKSSFLFKEMKTVFNDFLDNKNVENLTEMLLLLWTMKYLLNGDELAVEGNKLLDALSKLEGINPEDEARALLVLTVIERQDKVLSKAINKRIGKLKGKYPNTFRDLLPQQKKGFRP